jgi:hypothetical protein
MFIDLKKRVFQVWYRHLLGHLIKNLLIWTFIFVTFLLIRNKFGQMDNYIREQESQRMTLPQEATSGDEVELGEFELYSMNKRRSFYFNSLDREEMGLEEEEDTWNVNKTDLAEEAMLAIWHNNITHIVIFILVLLVIGLLKVSYYSLYS